MNGVLRSLVHEFISEPEQPVEPEALARLERMEKRYDPNQPRDEIGRWSDDGGAGLSDRAERALKSYNPFTKEKDEWATKNESEVIEMTGGSGTDNNAPMDVVVSANGKTYGIEVKTLLDNSNDKITVRGEALDRKKFWSRSNRASLHTVVIDDRKAFGKPGLDSGHRMYYRRGVGSFRLQSLTRVTDAAHLRKLMGIK